jgi:hypothetical protein
MWKNRKKKKRKLLPSSWQTLIGKNIKFNKSHLWGSCLRGMNCRESWKDLQVGIWLYTWRSYVKG